MGKHQFAKIFLIFLTFAVHMAMLGVSYLAVFPEKSRGLFTSETGNISHKYDLAAVPDDSAFSIWGAIYLSEALWLFNIDFNTKLTFVNAKARYSYNYLNMFGKRPILHMNSVRI
ncbi:Hypothetical predicted protein [Octopus vulgaris]|uniref:Uncharacterized protein n=1 Tax=Octopus vulgaris TaxID=6645 RepID=A0AA36AR10_OCTVU|nr:Hypothetical predicted protein [Octopus vulgaris]